MADSLDSLETVEGLMERVYETLSGDGEHPLDREGFEALFSADGNLATVGPEGDVSVDADEAWQGLYQFEGQMGCIYQLEAAGRTVFLGEGRALHWSTWEMYGNEYVPEPVSTGLASLSLSFRDGRWWIDSIVSTTIDDVDSLPEDLRPPPDPYR